MGKPEGIQFSCELERGAALVVLRCCPGQRRWADATRVQRSVLRRINPRSILFVEYQPPGNKFVLLRMNWSERLSSYIYAGETAMSETMVVALGLRSKAWRRALLAHALPAASGVATEVVRRGR